MRNHTPTNFKFETANWQICMLAVGLLAATPGIAQVIPYNPALTESAVESKSTQQQPTAMQTLIAGAEEAEDIRDIRGPVSIINPWLIALYCVIGLILCLLMAFLIYLFLKKRRKLTEEPELSPYDRALKDLEAARPMMQAGEHKAFTFCVSNVLRTYLEDQFSIPAPERTTEEFLAGMTGHLLIKGTLAELLSEFLQQCDLVKFARYPLGREQMQALHLNAEKFILESYVKFRMQETLLGQSGVKPLPEALPVAS